MNNVLEELDFDHLRDRIDDLREQKEVLLSNLRKMEKSRNEFREERDKLNKTASEKFSKVKELKKGRDETNIKINDLKITRKSVLEEMQGLIEKAKALQTEIQSLNITKVELNKSKKLRSQINKLDWNLQTTSQMDIAEERQIIERINALSSQLQQISVSEEKFHGLKKLNSQIHNLRGFLDHSWKEFQESVEFSQQCHREMTESYDEGKEAKEKADEMHENFVKVSEEVRGLKKDFRNINKDFKEKLSIYRDNMKKRKEETKQLRQEATQAMLSEQTEKIQEKLSKTKKKALSMDEMRILMSQDPDYLGFNAAEEEKTDIKEEN